MNMALPTNDKQKSSFKQLLKEACLKILLDRIGNIEQSILEARESANSEEKSSAGDKYETSRAMGHLAQEMLSKQLEDARQELEQVNRLTPATLSNSVSAGAVVVCNNFVFYISLGLGSSQIENIKVTLLSPKAPIAALLSGKKAGESFIFNHSEIKILDVF